MSQRCYITAARPLFLETGIPTLLFLLSFHHPGFCVATPKPAVLPKCPSHWVKWKWCICSSPPLLLSSRGGLEPGPAGTGRFVHRSLAPCWLLIRKLDAALSSARSGSRPWPSLGSGVVVLSCRHRKKLFPPDLRAASWRCALCSGGTLLSSPFLFPEWQAPKASPGGA